MTAIAILTVILGLIWVLTQRRPMRAWIRNKRHARNVRRSQEVLSTIRTFQGAHADARLYAYLRKISPYVMEELVLTCFEQQGITIRRNRRYTGDGGVDGRVYANGRAYLVQVKRYRRHINVRDVLEFTQHIDRLGVAGGLFVHTGRTGQRSWEEVHATKVRIVSGQRFVDFVRAKPGSANRLLGISPASQPVSCPNRTPEFNTASAERRVAH